MSTCNHCSYSRIEEDAKKKGKRVIRIPSKNMQQLGGYEIHILGHGEKASAKNWVAWMMEITDRCAC
jgi:hypothetical protein